MPAQPQLPGNAQGVDGKEADMLFGNGTLHFGGDTLFQFVPVPGAVEQEGPSLPDLGYDIVPSDVGGIVAGDEIRRLDVIGRHDGLVREAQMGFGDAVGFFGVVLKIRLSELVGMGIDDFHRVLVGAHRSVGAEAPEFAADQSL